MFKNRSLAREELIKLFYQMDIEKSFVEEKKIEYFANILKEEDEIVEDDEAWKEEKEFIDICTKILIENKEEIDRKIQKASPKWQLNRFSKVDLAILRLAACEICYTDIPVQVVINEAIELAKKFSNEEDTKLVHGILGAVTKDGKESNIYKIEKND